MQIIGALRWRAHSGTIGLDMQRVRINKLKPGEVFAESLFLASGQKLLNSGTVLTQRHLDVMYRHGDLEVILAESLQELEAEGIVSPCDGRKLTVGQRAKAGVVSRAGQVVLEPGEEIEEHHLDAVEAGGAYLGRSSAAEDEARERAAHRERLLLADELAEALVARTDKLPLRVAPAGHSDWIVPGDPSQWPGVPQLAEQRAQAVQVLRQLFARIEAGVPVAVSDFMPLLDELLDKLSKFPTRFTQLALLIKGRDDYLPDHAYTTAVLAMSIAANLKWDRDDVRQVGLAAMVFDLGMLLVPHRIRIGACELTDIDRGRVQKHPMGTLAMLECTQHIPDIVKLAALQHHERENGSGYPRGKRKDLICDYARVLGVADAFAATMSPRHYRKQKLPYVAMEETLRQASTMVLWPPACRALVQSAGLFPVGSYVKLSSGQRAHVIGSNSQSVDRPLIQPLDDQGQPIGTTIDLSEIPKQTLAVVRPIDINVGPI